MKKVLLISALAVGSAFMHAEEILRDSLSNIKLEEVVVSATRVGNNAPIAHSNMNSDEIKSNNAGRNLPYILQTLPSVVSYSEGGTAIGNTSFRIRGTDANRINVTLNGMPLNNPESQDVYWVNLPDISSSLQNIQVQRGVGTSTNGAASFGASVSMKTEGSKQKAYGEASTAIGSYRSMISSIAAGTGILKNGLSLDGRFSRTTGDGYIRNAKVDHTSGYAALSHYTDKQLIKVIYIYGEQHTGITWLGADPDSMKTNRTYNSAGEYKDEAKNIHYYDNETDNYYSNIAQLLYTRQLTDKLNLNANFSYNNGYGYYENYKKSRDFVDDYKLQPQLVNGITYTTSDAVVRKMMSNNLYSGNANINYTLNKWKLSAGGMYSYYAGEHFGRLPWIKYNQNIPKNYQWYESDATKKDANVFAKAEYSLNQNLNLFADMQYRYIDYRLKGIDDDFADITQKNYYSFFNPKLGASLRFLDYNSVYASFGISNREPLREDLKESVKRGATRDITSERLYDYELGYKYARATLSLGANLYYMDYKDQLVQTGRLSDTGYKLQQNVPDSYRMGIELEAAWTPLDWLRLDANTTISRNKIKNYTAYYPIYDPSTWELVDPIEHETKFYKSTNISFSPTLVGNGIITVIPTKNLSLALINKYVGKMYYDNTSNRENQLDDYFISDLMAGYTFQSSPVGEIELQFFVYNLWNKKYLANAWIDPYKFSDGSEYIYRGVFPQAPRNIMTRIAVKF